MGWKSVVWVCCLPPVFAGCGSVHELTADQQQAQVQHNSSYRNPGPPVVPYKPIPPKPRPNSDTLPQPRSTPKGDKFAEMKQESDDTPSNSDPTSTDLEKLFPARPRHELPVIPPFNPQLPGDKFSLPSNPDLLPIPNPPLPIPRLEPPPVPPDPPKLMVPPVLEIPELNPPSTVIPSSLKLTTPLLPASVPPPAVLDDIPVRPFQYALPTPAPAWKLTPGK